MRKSGLAFLLIFTFFSMVTLFSTTGFASEIREERIQRLFELRDRAIELGAEELAFRYEIRALSWQGFDTPPSIEFETSVMTGVLSGIISVGVVFAGYKISTNYSKELIPRIWTSKLFLRCSLILIFYVTTYLAFGILFNPQAIHDFFMMAAAGSFGFLLTFICYLHLVLERRAQVFENDKNSSEQYLTSVELEHKTWLQVVQSTIFALLFIFGGVLLTLFVNLFEVNDLGVMKDAWTFAMFQASTIGLLFLGTFFGIFFRILAYASSLSDILRETKDKTSE